MNEIFVHCSVIRWIDFSISSFSSLNYFTCFMRINWHDNWRFSERIDDEWLTGLLLDEQQCCCPSDKCSIATPIRLFRVILLDHLFIDLNLLRMKSQKAWVVWSFWQDFIPFWITQKTSEWSRRTFHVCRESSTVRRNRNSDCWIQNLWDHNQFIVEPSPYLMLVSTLRKNMGEWCDYYHWLLQLGYSNYRLTINRYVHQSIIQIVLMYFGDYENGENKNSLRMKISFKGQVWMEINSDYGKISFIQLRKGEIKYLLYHLE